ncbi:unnamed protein product [Phaeothamnion confervicola]
MLPWHNFSDGRFLDIQDAALRVCWFTLDAEMVLHGVFANGNGCKTFVLLSFRILLPASSRSPLCFARGCVFVDAVQTRIAGCRSVVDLPVMRHCSIFAVTRVSCFPFAGESVAEQACGGFSPLVAAASFCCHKWPIDCQFFSLTFLLLGRLFRIPTLSRVASACAAPFVRVHSTDIGAAYGTAKSGVGISSMGVMNPGLVMRNIIPVVMAGVLGIYGLIVAVILQGSITMPDSSGNKFSAFSGFAFLAAGLCCGMSGLAAGMAIGIVGDAGVRAVGQQERLFVGMILILIFAEALGLYGLIVALILSQQSYSCS